MKQAVIRKVKSMYVGCDKVGNLLLVKFSYEGAKDSCVYFPSEVVFWFLKNIPANQHPDLPAPPPGSPLNDWDWDERAAPRVRRVDCEVTHNVFRMTMELQGHPQQTVVMDAPCVELLRRFFLAYSDQLIDLDA